MTLNKIIPLIIWIVGLQVFWSCSIPDNQEHHELDSEVLLEIARERNKMQSKLLQSTVNVAELNKWDLLGTERLKLSRFADTVSDIAFGADRFVAFIDEGLLELHENGKFSNFTKENFKQELKHYRNHAELYKNELEVVSFFNKPEYNPFSYKSIKQQELVLEELKGIALVSANQWIIPYMFMHTRTRTGKGDTLVHTSLEDVNERVPTVEEILLERKKRERLNN